MWPDWAIFWTLGNFLKALATINLPQSSPFLVDFCEGVKIIHFCSETIFGHLLYSFGDFYLATLIRMQSAKSLELICKKSGTKQIKHFLTIVCRAECKIFQLEHKGTKLQVMPCRLSPSPQENCTVNAKNIIGQCSLKWREIKGVEFSTFFENPKNKFDDLFHIILLIFWDGFVMDWRLRRF